MSGTFADDRASLAILPSTSDGKALLPILQEAIKLQMVIAAFEPVGPRVEAALEGANNLLDHVWELLVEAASRDANNVRAITRGEVDAYFGDGNV